MKPIITRFAPSPTGFLHIGGIRTAIYNYLFAKYHKGKYLLRIEDTDKERSTKEAIDSILLGLKWLEIENDGEVIYQSQNIEQHRKAVQTLLDKGKAYKCFCSPEELQKMREKAQKTASPVLYDGTWRDKSPADHPKDTPYVIRLKSDNQTHGNITANDLVQGKIIVNRNTLDDFVLMRSDGSPTYMLSVVVDDHNMQISHVIRGVDHLTNTFRQISLYEAFGWDIPQFAHIGLLHGNDGKKLSKRHGALDVNVYKDMGFLPSAIVHYLANIGWAGIDEKQKNISLQDMIPLFNLKKHNLSKSAAQFDPEKLNSINAEHIRSHDKKYIFELTWNTVKNKYNTNDSNLYLSAIPVLTKRAKTLNELINNAKFFLDEKNYTELSDKLSPHVETLILIRDYLNNSNINWEEENLKQLLNSFVETQGLPFAKVGKPLRMAITGASASPGDLSEVLSILGKERTISLINQAISEL